MFGGWRNFETSHGGEHENPTQDEGLAVEADVLFRVYVPAKRHQDKEENALDSQDAFGYYYMNKLFE